MGILILFVIIFLIRLPALNLLRWSQDFSLTTHILVKILTIFLFLTTIITDPYLFSKKIKNNKLFGLIFLYLAGVNLSITGVINLFSFFSALEKYFISVFLFFIIFIKLNKKNLIPFLAILVTSSVINLFFQFLIYFMPILFKIIQEFLYQKYVNFYLYQFGRHRFFGSTLDEVLIPIIILLFLITKNKFLKAFFFLNLFAIIFITIASNWRTKSILTLLGLLSSFFIIAKYKNIKKEKVINYIFLLIIGTLFTIYISNFVTLNTRKINVLDRFFFSDESDSGTLISRFNYWYQALQIGLGFPIFGVGVGNYFDNLSPLTQRQTMILIGNKPLLLIEDPHNIFLNTFSTMGTFGLFVLIILLIYFLISDIKNYNKDSGLQACIMCFWLLFAYGLFNPVTSFNYLCFFWIIRGSIEKLKHIL